MINVEELYPRVQRNRSDEGVLYAASRDQEVWDDSEEWIEYVPAPSDTPEPSPLSILDRLVAMGPDKIREIADFIAPAPVKCTTCRDDPRGELIDCDGSAGYRKCTGCGAERAR